MAFLGSFLSSETYQPRLSACGGPLSVEQIGNHTLDHPAPSIGWTRNDKMIETVMQRR